MAGIDRSDEAIALALVGKNGPGGKEPAWSTGDIKNPSELWGQYVTGFRQGNNALDKAFEQIFRRGVDDTAGPADQAAAKFIDLAFRQIGVVEAEFAPDKNNGPASADQLMTQLTELHDLRVMCALEILDTGSEKAPHDLAWAVASTPSLYDTPLAKEVHDAGGKYQSSTLADEKSMSNSELFR